MGGGGATKSVCEQEGIVLLKIEEPGHTRIDAGGRNFFPYGKDNKEAYLSICVSN